MDKETIIHTFQNSRYRIVFERSAVKGIDGFKVEANGDDLTSVEQEAKVLLEYAQRTTKGEE